MENHNDNWIGPFVPNDAIGNKTNSKVVMCKDCGLKTMPGTEDDVVHKPSCTLR